MAQPISLDITTHPHQVELLDRLSHASEQHAAALLAGLDLLQALHDEGVLDLLRGAVSARGKLSERLASAADSTESIRAFRNLFLMGRMLSSIDPETMRHIAANKTTSFTCRVNRVKQAFFGNGIYKLARYYAGLNRCLEIVFVYI